MKQKAREYNYDLLRVLSMMAVILMHVGMDSGGGTEFGMANHAIYL